MSRTHASSDPVRVYIGLGSNLNDPVEQISMAIEALSELPATTFCARSSLYRSAPMATDTSLVATPDQTYDREQPDYINAVVCLNTYLPALALLDSLQEIEKRQGKQQDPDGLRWAPRTLDLDLLLYGEALIDHPRLQVPHPGLAEREFVLHPLYEIAPDLNLPDGSALAKLLETCPMRGMIKLPSPPKQ